MFKEIKIGDELTRMLGGRVPIKVEVSRLTEEFIFVKPVDKTNFKEIEGVDIDWRFNRQTGMEVEPTIGWDGETKSGSYLTLKPREIKSNPHKDVLAMFSMLRAYSSGLAKVGSIEEVVTPKLQSVVDTIIGVDAGGLTELYYNEFKRVIAEIETVSGKMYKSGRKMLDILEHHINNT